MKNIKKILVIFVAINISFSQSLYNIFSFRNAYHSYCNGFSTEAKAVSQFAFYVKNSALYKTI